MSNNTRRYAAQHIHTITNDRHQMTTDDVLKDLGRLDNAGEVWHQDVILEILDGESKVNVIDKLRKDVISTFKLTYVTHAETLNTEAHKGLVILYAKTGKRTSDVLILKCTETMASIVVDDLNRSSRNHAAINRKAVSFRTSSPTSSSGSEQTAQPSRLIPISEQSVQENYRLAEVREDFLGRTTQELSVRYGEVVKMTLTPVATTDASKICEVIWNTEFNDIQHEAVIFHDDPITAAKSFSNGANLEITAVTYTEDDETTTTDTNKEKKDLIKLLVLKYAALLTNWRSSLGIIFAIFFVVIICAVVSLTQYPIPDFSDPSKGFEARGTLISKRLISVHHLAYSASIPNSLITQPNMLISNRHNTYELPEQAIPTRVMYESTRTNTTNMYVQETTTYVKSNISLISSNKISTQNKLDYGTIKLSLVNGDGLPVIDRLYYHQRWLPNTLMDQCITIDKDFMGVVFQSNTDDPNLLNTGSLQSICRWQRQIHRKYFNDLPNCTFLSVADFVLHLNNKVACDDIVDSDIQVTYDLIETCSRYYYNSSLKRPYATNGDVPQNCTELNAVYAMLHYLTDTEFYKNLVFPGNWTNLTSTLVFLPLLLGNHNDSLIYDILDTEFEGMKEVDNGESKIVALKVDRYGVFFHYFWRDTFLVGGSASCIVFVIWFYSKSFFITCMTLLNFLLSLSLAYFTYTVIVQVEFFPFLAVTTALLIVAIGADDTFVFLEIWNESNDYEEDRLNAMIRTLRHAAPTMFVTSLTTSSAFFINMISPITAVRCFGLYAGTAIIFNFLLTLSWLPSVVILNEALHQSIQQYIPSPRCLLFLSEKIHNLSNLFFKVWLPYVVIKFRFLWIILFAFLGFIGAFVIFWSPGLRLPTSNFPVFDNSNIIEKYESKYQGLFRFEKDGGSGSILNMQFIWGVTPADNGDHWNPDDRGYLVLDTPLDFNEDVQKWMLNFCASVRIQGFYAQSSNSSDENCFMETFAKYMAHDCSANEFHSADCCGRSNTTFNSETFKSCLPHVVKRHPNIKNYIFSDSYGNIRGVRVQFPSKYTLSRMYTPMDNYWSEVNTWSASKLSTAPEGLTGGWFITDYNMIQLYFYDLQKSLVKSSSFSLLTSIALAAIILFIVTRNLLLSTFAMLSIMGTIFVTIGSLVLLGWELNIMESVVFSLAVGLSVDFTIHYSVAYRLAPYPDRPSRVGFSIRSLAPAITMAAFSTFVPGACMFPAASLVYQQMSVFLTLIMSVSLTFSTFFFQSLCYIIGPQGNACELSVCCGSTSKEYEMTNRLKATAVVKDSNLVVVEFK